MLMEHGQNNVAVLEPHLALGSGNTAAGGGGGTNRYPNPFFTLAQEYAPRTVKELHRWCSYFFYTNPVVYATITKVSRYPITELIYDDPDQKTRDFWKRVFEEHLKIKDRNMEVNLDLNVYGNAFVSFYTPFIRYLICQTCKNRENITNMAWQWTAYQFGWVCPKCNTRQVSDPEKPETIKDVPYKSLEDMKIIRWNPENIGIRYNEATGESHYFYNVSRSIRYQVQNNEKEIIERLPLIFLVAIKRQRLVKMSNENLFHLKRPTLAEKDMGWGKPLIQPVLGDLYYQAILRRAQEAIANEHIVPFDFLYPTPNAQMDPFVHSDLGSWKTKVEQALLNRRRDPNYKAILPVPMGFGRLGGDGKAMLITPELNLLNQQICGGMGIPVEFLMGGLNWCITSKSLVFTNDGMLKLEEVCPDTVSREISTSHRITATRDGNRKIAINHRTSPKQQFTVKTKLGLSLTGSKIHKILKINSDLTMSWDKISELVPGDYVAVKKGTELWGNEDLLPEQARLFGYLISEGSISSKRITFANTDPEIVTDFALCWKKVFGNTPKFNGRDAWKNHHGKKKVYQFDTRNFEQCSYFKELGCIGKAAKKEVPRIIRSSTRDSICQFLKALFEGDGSIGESNNKRVISYASKSEALIEQVQLLLLNMGIVSSSYNPYGEENNVTHTLQIRSSYVDLFMKEIGFVSTTKSGRYRDIPTDNKHLCEHTKIPYLTEKLRDLKASNGRFRHLKTELPDKEVFTTKEVAELLGRDSTNISKWVKKGSLFATKEVRTDGQFGTYFIKRADLELFLDSYSTVKQKTLGNHNGVWDITAKSEEEIDWDTVRCLDPELYDKYQTIKKEGHLWVQVTEVSSSIEEVEMCDLTVYDTHSYVANGIVSHNTGSSITLRSLQNDFQHNQTQLLSLNNWIKNKIKIFLQVPDIMSMRFTDFKMADDIQRITQFIQLNAARKLSDETLLTELGLDYEKETKKLIQEIKIQNEVQDIMMKAQARSAGETQIISYGYQQELQEMQMEDQQKMQQQQMGQQDPNAQSPDQTEQDPNDPNAQQGPDPMGQQDYSQPPQQQQGAGMPGQQQNVLNMDVTATAKKWARNLLKMDQGSAMQEIMQIKQQMPAFGKLVEDMYKQIATGAEGKEITPTVGAAGVGGGASAAQANPSGAQPNMNPMPVKGAPTRAGSV